MKLSKTDYILWRECKKNVWVKKHLPEVYKSFPISEFDRALVTLGDEVEKLARGMFPGGYLVEARGSEAEELTKKLIAERTSVIFQALFTTDKFLAATDVMRWNEEAGAYDLYEIKMSSTEEEDEDGKKKINKKKETQFEHDLTFQYNVLTLCGVKINTKYLVRLNKEYVRHGELDYSNLFILEDKSARVEELSEAVLAEMESAYNYLMLESEPEGNCTCYFHGRSAHCTTFSHNNSYQGQPIPEYSVHDLNRIGNSPKLLAQYLAEGVVAMDDVPDDDRLNPSKPKKDEEPRPPRKRNQVKVHHSKIPIIDRVAIRRELDSLVYPLYFLDYETSPAPVPPYSGYRPYQQIVFQYSLHVLQNPDAKPEHYEKLFVDGDPAEIIASSLKGHIGPTGSVIVWFKTFENTRNRDLAKIVPEYADFFLDLVERTYDLMTIVDRQHYVHPEFKGSASIKSVGPVLAADVIYDTLVVKGGTDAIEGYRQLTKDGLVGAEREKKISDMLEYCKLDTWAMVRIWQEFMKLVVV